MVTALAGEEDFVTAVLAEFHDDHTMTLVNCGHHRPVLVTAAETAALVATGEPVPPLGLGPTPRCVTARWPEGCRMLLYTDGLVEARDRGGRFFPLTDHAVELGEGTLDEILDRLLTRLITHAGDQLNDDMALVLIEHRTD